MGEGASRAQRPRPPLRGGDAPRAGAPSRWPPARTAQAAGPRARSRGLGRPTLTEGRCSRGGVRPERARSSRGGEDCACSAVWQLPEGPAARFRGHAGQSGCCPGCTCGRGAPLPKASALCSARFPRWSVRSRVHPAQQTGAECMSRVTHGRCPRGDEVSAPRMGPSAAFSPHDNSN